MNKKSFYKLLASVSLLGVVTSQVIVQHQVVYANDFATQKGTFTVGDSVINVRSQPNTDAEIVASYQPGQQVNYDQIGTANGYRWISYVGGSGNRNYVAIGTADGSNSFGSLNGQSDKSSSNDYDFSEIAGDWVNGQGETLTISNDGFLTGANLYGQSLKLEQSGSSFGLSQRTFKYDGKTIFFPIIAGLEGNVTEEQAKQFSDMIERTGRFYRPGSVPKDTSAPADFTSEKGTFTVGSSVINVRSQPSTNAEVVASYQPGQKVNYDQIGVANGYRWVSYVASSGSRRYLAIGTADGQASYGSLSGGNKASVSTNNTVEQKTFTGHAWTGENPYKDFIIKVAETNNTADSQPTTLDYVLYDIDNNGTPELLLGRAGQGWIYEIYTLVNGQPTKVVGTGVVGGVGSSAYRGGIGIYENGDIILSEWGSGTGEGTNRTYRLKSDNTAPDEPESKDFSMREGDKPGDSSRATLDVASLDWKSPADVDKDKSPQEKAPETSSSSKTDKGNAVSSSSSSSSTKTETSQSSKSSQTETSQTDTSSSTTTTTQPTTEVKQEVKANPIQRVYKTLTNRQDLPSTGESVSVLGGVGLLLVGLAAFIHRRRK